MIIQNGAWLRVQDKLSRQRPGPTVPVSRSGKAASPRVKTGMRPMGASTVTVPPPATDSPVQPSVHFWPAGR